MTDAAPDRGYAYQLPESPYAGENEKKLRRLASSSPTEIDSAAAEWKAGAEALSDVAATLKTQAGSLREAYGNKKGNGAGDYAADRYELLAKAVMVREDEMRNVVKGLEDSSKVVLSARLELEKLPTVSSPPDHQVANPRFEKLYEQQAEDHQASVNAREVAATAAAGRIDAEFEEAAKKMGQPLPDKNTYTTPQPTGGGTSAAPSAPASSGATTPHLIGPSQGDTPHAAMAVGNQPVDVQSGGPLTGTGEVGDPGTDGDLSGASVIQPGESTVTGAGTPTTSAGGAVGSGAAAGAGMAALGGAGAVAGTRGASAARGASVKGGKTAALGRSSAAASRGALGKSVPAGGQGSTGGSRRGGAGTGRAGGRMTAGAGAGQPGRSGGRGGAGARGGAGGRGTAAGSKGTTSSQGKGSGASGRKAPLSAAATGGRKGKRDRDDQAREGIVFADEHSWLDDEQTGDAVID